MFRRRTCYEFRMIACEYGCAKESCPRTGFVEQIQHLAEPLGTDIELFSKSDRMVVFAWQIKLLYIKREKHAWQSRVLNCPE